MDKREPIRRCKPHSKLFYETWLRYTRKGNSARCRGMWYKHIALLIVNAQRDFDAAVPRSMALQAGKAMAVRRVKVLLSTHQYTSRVLR